MRSTGLAAVLVPLLACTPGEPQTSATVGSTSTTTASTGATDTTASTGTTSTTGVTTSGQTASEGATSTPTSTSTSTTTTTTSDATSTTAVATSTTTGPDTTSSTGDTGVVPDTCGVAKGDYGDCDLALGVAFDGVECTSRSGCDCAPDCDKFFPDMASCALTCAADGHCNEDRLEAAALAMDPVQQGNHCDGVYVCADGPPLEDVFEAIFGMLTCEPGGFPCQGGQTCAGLYSGELGPEEWLKVCAASLVQMSGPIYCVVFGP